MRLIDADALIQDMIDKKIPFNADVNEAILSAREIGNYADYVDRVWEIAYERGKEEAFQWIPCSERLPDEDGYYLTTTMYKEVYCDYWSEVNFDRTEMVIAWMELPEPYGGDD